MRDTTREYSYSSTLQARTMYNTKNLNADIQELYLLLYIEDNHLGRGTYTLYCIYIARYIYLQLEYP